MRMPTPYSIWHSGQYTTRRLNDQISMHYCFTYLELMFAMELQRVFDTFIFLNRNATSISVSSTDIILLCYMTFDILLNASSRALELRQHADTVHSCPWLEQVTPQPGEEKTSCHIFSVDKFANRYIGPLPCLYCGALSKKRKQIYLYLLVILIRYV